MKRSSLDVIKSVFSVDLNKECIIEKDDKVGYVAYKFIFLDDFIPSCVLIDLPKLYKKGFDFYVRYCNRSRCVYLRVYKHS